MATNGANNVEDADMAECDGQKVVTMMDVLQEQQDFEDDANAVLGASDEKNCTYSKGYIKRQAIYACLTCCSEAKDDPTKRAGVCLACSLNCHENHELIELYTKRNFRCDCGNPKFNSNPCQFTLNKTDLNEDNIYNQNFSGLYCNCHRPYPDPESTVEDEEMIQCIICEDWLHASHLDAVVPGSDQYSEMICKACMEKNEFLHDYSNFTVNLEIGDVDIIAVNGTDFKLSNGDLEAEKIINGTGDLLGDYEKPKILMDVDEEQIKNNSLTESDHTMTNHELVENKETVKENEIIDSSDVTMEVEKTTENSVSQIISSDQNIESKDESALTSEENTKATEDTLNEVNSESLESTKATENTSDEVHSESLESTKATENTSDEVNSESLESNQFGNAEESKTLQDEDTKEIDENYSKTEKSVETSDKNVETPETEDKTAAITLENDKEDEEMVDSNDLLEKQEEVAQTIINNSPSEDTEITTLENDSEGNDSSKETAETVNADTTKDEETTNKTESDKANDFSEEITFEAEINAQAAETRVDDPSNEVTSETEIANKTDSNETDKILNDTTSEVDFNHKSDGTITAAKTTEAEINDIEIKIPSTETPIDAPNEEVSSESSANKIEVPEETICEIPQNKENKRKLSTEEATDDSLVKKPKIDEESKCIRPKGIKRVHKGATFWPSNFRQKLCMCSECLSIYKDLSVLFLIDPEDTVFAYETLGKERVDGRATQYEKGLEALSSLGRIQQINALTEYNKMKDKLLDFLKSFKDRKEIVKEEDIKAFFAGMKPKREPDGVYFCR